MFGTFALSVGAAVSFNFLFILFNLFLDEKVPILF
jgi:hypothetical protein